MKAGAHITNQVKLHRSFAEHYRREARIHRRKAEEMEKFASESDANAARWAAGTDLADITQTQDKP